MTCEASSGGRSCRNHRKPPAVPSSLGYRQAWSAIHRMIMEGRSWSGYERNCAYLNLGREPYAGLLSGEWSELPG